MNSVKLTGSLFLIALFLVGFVSSDKEPVGRITFPVGQVFVLPAGSNKLQMAGFNREVFPGDKIETKRESRCEITLRNGDVIRVGENSLYTLEDIEITSTTVRAESFLNFGKIWINIRKLFSRDDFNRVKSPTAVIAVRGTVYRLDVASDSTTLVRVYRGQVEVKSASTSTSAPGKSPGEKLKPEWPPRDTKGPDDVEGPRDVTMKEWLEIVKAQQQILIHPDGSYQKSAFDLQKDAASEWVQWNRMRDRLLR